MKKIALVLALLALSNPAFAQSSKVVIGGVDTREWGAREKHLTEIVSELSAQMADVISRVEIQLMDAVEAKNALQAQVDWWQKPENRAWVDAKTPQDGAAREASP